MKRSIRPLPRRGLGLAVPVALALACGGTETDNPVTNTPDGQAPESPIQFDHLRVPGGCVPDVRDAPPRLASWAENGELLVGWDGGLVVVDTSDPAAPRQLSRVDIDGYPRQVLLGPDSVTIAVDQWPGVVGAPAGPLGTVTRLIQYDLRQPDAPLEVASIPLDGEFWRLLPQPGGFWLMSARIDPSSFVCEVGPEVCNYVDREAIELRRFTFAGGLSSAGERVELPYGSSVFTSAGGVATVADTTTSPASVLHVALFDGSGGLSLVDPFEVDHGLYGDPAPIELLPDRILVFGQSLAVYDAQGRRLGGAVLDLAVGAESHVVGNGAFVASSDAREEGAFVDFGDPSAPVVTRLAQVSEVLPIAEPGGAAPRRALGWYQDTGGLELSLLSLETSPPSVIGQLETDYELLDSRADFWVDGARAFFLAHTAGGELVFGAIDWTGDELSVQALGEYASDAFEIGGYSYWLGEDRLRVAALGGSPATALELGREQVIDVAPGAAGEARLLVARDAGRRLELTRAGVTQSLAFSSAAARVLAAGDRWLVLETERAPGCEVVGSDCPPPAVTVVGEDPARAVARIELPLIDVPLGPGSSVIQQWMVSDDAEAGPIPLAAGRWVLVRQLDATCRGVADCEALGLRALSPEQAAAQGVNVGSQTPDCPPQASGESAPCEQPPALPPEIGWGTRRAFFVLDASTASLGAPTSIDVQGEAYFAPGLALSPRPEETLLSLRIEPLVNQPGQPRRARFMLDRLRIGADASENVGSNFVPGYPIGLLDADTLLSVQPTAESAGAARLVRSELGSLGVSIVAERGIEARFIDGVIVGEHAVSVRWPNDPCLGTTTLESLRLDADLVPVQQLVLPGAGEVVGVDGRDVILSDRGQRFTRVHVADDGTLTVAAEAEASQPLNGVEWRDGTLYGLASGQVERLPL